MCVCLYDDLERWYGTSHKFYCYYYSNPHLTQYLCLYFPCLFPIRRRRLPVRRQPSSPQKSSRAVQVHGGRPLPGSFENHQTWSAAQVECLNCTFHWLSQVSGWWAAQKHNEPLTWLWSSDLSLQCERYRCRGSGGLLCDQWSLLYPDASESFRGASPGSALVQRCLLQPRGGQSGLWRISLCKWNQYVSRQKVKLSNYYIYYVCIPPDFLFLFLFFSFFFRHLYVVDLFGHNVHVLDRKEDNLLVPVKVSDADKEQGLSVFLITKSAVSIVFSWLNMASIWFTVLFLLSHKTNQFNQCNLNIQMRF